MPAVRRRLLPGMQIGPHAHGRCRGSGRLADSSGVRVLPERAQRNGGPRVEPVDRGGDSEPRSRPPAARPGGDELRCRSSANVKGRRHPCRSGRRYRDVASPRDSRRSRRQAGRPRRRVARRDWSSAPATALRKRPGRSRRSFHKVVMKSPAHARAAGQRDRRPKTSR